MTRSIWLQRNRGIAGFILAHPDCYSPHTVEIANRFLAFHGDEQ